MIKRTYNKIDIDPCRYKTTRVDFVIKKSLYNQRDFVDSATPVDLTGKALSIKYFSGASLLGTLVPMITDALNGAGYFQIAPFLHDQLVSSIYAVLEVDGVRIGDVKFVNSIGANCSDCECDFEIEHILLPCDCINLDTASTPTMNLQDTITVELSDNVNETINHTITDESGVVIKDVVVMVFDALGNDTQMPYATIAPGVVELRPALVGGLNIAHIVSISV